VRKREKEREQERDSKREREREKARAREGERERAREGERERERERKRVRVECMTCSVTSEIFVVPEKKLAPKMYCIKCIKSCCFTNLYSLRVWGDCG